jgi:cobalt-zinc-cadmium resistance protein CzcA
MAKQGQQVGVVREGERVFDLVVRLGGEGVEDEHDLGRLPLATQQGNLVPLNMVADLKLEDTVVIVGREQMKRRLIVQTNVRGRDMVGFVKEAQAKVAAGVQVPKSIEVVWGGQFENFNRAKTRLSMLVPISIAVIGLMLVFMFRSVKYMFITVINLPFAVAGGVFAMVLRGLPFSIPAGVGFIALFGVAVLNGVVLVSFIRRTQAAGGVTPQQAAQQAAESRLRPVLMTALVASLGFVPMAIATGAGAEVQKPLATVVIGGLVTSTLLTLVVVPALYRWFAPPDPARRS